MNKQLTELNAKLNARIAATGYKTPSLAPALKGNSKILGDALTKVAQKRMADFSKPKYIEATTEGVEVETESERIERKMCEAAAEIKAEQEVKKQDPEYVKYVKQFSPEVVDTLIGSEEKEETKLVLTIEETYDTMMEASNELREAVEDTRFNEEETRDARNEYKSFVEMYGGSGLIEISASW